MITMIRTRQCSFATASRNRAQDVIPQRYNTHGRDSRHDRASIHPFDPENEVHNAQLVFQPVSSSMRSAKVLVRGKAFITAAGSGIPLNPVAEEEISDSCSGRRQQDWFPSSTARTSEATGVNYSPKSIKAFRRRSTIGSNGRLSSAFGVVSWRGGLKRPHRYLPALQPIAPPHPFSIQQSARDQLWNVASVYPAARKQREFCQEPEKPSDPQQGGSTAPDPMHNDTGSWVSPEADRRAGGGGVQLSAGAKLSKVGGDPCLHTFS
ncbi:hypothetical protein DFJ74DRAFT_676941 [Hyaloraphidium curvatum]|nr:hypothetical protein DFJ74DRAFT_676941 [Hyaloraphidium curvatum]